MNNNKSKSLSNLFNKNKRQKIEYSILSKNKILQEIKNGNIFIYNFNIEQLNTCSYDIVLGNYYFREQNPDKDKSCIIYCADDSEDDFGNLNTYVQLESPIPDAKPKSKKIHIYNQYNRANVTKKWGSINESISAKQFKENHEVKLEGIDDDEHVILIHPGETLLCHSEEFIGGIKNVTTMLKGKSSMRRSNITICEDAGWGDIGYCNRWTLEITNKSKYYSTILVVGRPIGQIVFMKTDDCDECYTKKGKYQDSGDVYSMIRKWKPTDMLPKSYLYVRRRTQSVNENKNKNKKGNYTNLNG